MGHTSDKKQVERNTTSSFITINSSSLQTHLQADGMKVISLLVIVSLISASQAGWNWHKIGRFAHHALRIYYGDEVGQNKEMYTAAMTQFLNQLSDEIGEENAHQLIKDVAKMIEDNESDERLADEFNFDEVASNKASNEEEKEGTQMEEHDAQVNEDAELMELLRSLKQNL